MRPACKSRHYLAVAILAIAALVYAFVAYYDNRLSDAQINAATAALKQHDPSIFSGDDVFGSSGMWRMDAPLPRYILHLALSITDYRDVLLPFRIATGVIAFIYLCGMYALAYRVSRSWSCAVFVAVLSSRVTYVLGNAYWGVGSLGSAAPEGLCIALAPWLMLALLSCEGNWRMAAVFFVIGLLGNLHLASAINFSIVLLLVLLVRGGFGSTRRNMGIFIACVLLCLLGMAPEIWRKFSLWLPIERHAGISEALEAFHLGRLRLLYGPALRAALRWCPIAAVLAIPSVAVLASASRFKMRNVRLWLWLIASTLVVSLGLHSLSIFVGELLDEQPKAIDFIRASSLIMLPLYVFFAVAVTSMFRIAGKNKALLRWACAILMVLYMLPSDNFRLPRHRLLAAGAGLLGKEDRPRNVLRHAANRQARSELAAIAEWARQNTPPDAVFLTNSARFRMLSQRSIVAAGSDVRYIYHLAPGQLGPWVSKIRDLQRLYAGPVDFSAVRQYVSQLTAEGGDASRYYVILNVGESKGSGLIEIEPNGWGKTYRLLHMP